MVKIVSSDKVEFELSREACQLSGFLSGILDENSFDLQEGEVITIPKVDNEALTHIVKWMEYHKDKEMREIEKPLQRPLFRIISSFDKQFLQNLNDEMLVKVIEGANFMNVQSLVELCAAHISEFLKGKSIREIRLMFEGE